MTIRKFSIKTALAIIAIVAILVAIFVKHHTVEFEATSTSPNGQLTVSISAIKHSTLLTKSFSSQVELRNAENGTLVFQTRNPISQDSMDRISNDPKRIEPEWSKSSDQVKYRDFNLNGVILSLTPSNNGFSITQRQQE